MAYIRAWMSSKFGQFRSGTIELAALEHLKNRFCPFLVSQLWFYLGNSQVSIYRTIGPLVYSSHEHFLTDVTSELQLIDVPHQEKICFLHMRKQRCRSATLLQHLCFRYIDSTIPLLRKSEIQSSSHLLWLCIPVCVRSGLKPRRQVFSRCGSYSKNE